MLNIRKMDLFEFSFTCQRSFQILGIAVRIEGLSHVVHTISQEMKDKESSHTRLQLSVTHSRPQDTLLQG